MELKINFILNVKKKCKGFGIINRNVKIKNFILSKPHNIKYYEHTYYIKNISPKNLIEKKLTKDG